MREVGREGNGRESRLDRGENKKKKRRKKKNEAPPLTSTISQSSIHVIHPSPVSALAHIP